MFATYPFFDNLTTDCFDTYYTVRIENGMVDFSGTLLNGIRAFSGQKATRQEFDRFIKFGPKAVVYSIASIEEEEEEEEEKEKNLTTILALYQANPVVLRIECFCEDEDWWKEVLTNLPPSVEYLHLCDEVPTEAYKFIPQTVHSVKVYTNTEEICKRTGTVWIERVASQHLNVECWKLIVDVGPVGLVIESDTVEYIVYPKQSKKTKLKCPKLKHLNALDTRFDNSHGLETLMCKSLKVGSKTLKMLWCQEGIDTSTCPNLEVYHTNSKKTCFGTSTKLSSLVR